MRTGREKENNSTPREGDKQICDHAGVHDSQTTALLMILIVLSRIFQDAIEVILRLFEGSLARAVESKQKNNGLPSFKKQLTSVVRFPRPHDLTSAAASKLSCEDVQRRCCAYYAASTYGCSKLGLYRCGAPPFFEAKGEQSRRSGTTSRKHGMYYLFRLIFIERRCSLKIKSLERKINIFSFYLENHIYFVLLK